VLVGQPLPKQVLDSAADPAAVGQQTFDVSRRGFNQQQVQQYLLAVAESLRDAQDREADIRTRLGKAIRRAEAAEKAKRSQPKTDATGSARQVGDNVATVLGAADDVAATRMAEAQTSAEEIVADARAKAREITAKAEARADDIVNEGMTAAQVLRDEARQDADATVGKAAARVEQVRDECDGLIREAEEARGQILEDMERRRRQARAQVERLRVGRDRLLRSFEVARRTLDETTVDLKSSLNEAKVRGDSAARAVASETPQNRQQLETELADAKLIGRIKISEPTDLAVSETKPAERELRSPALPRPIDPPATATSEDAANENGATSAPHPRKPVIEGAAKTAARKIPPQPKAPAAAPILRASDADASKTRVPGSQGGSARIEGGGAKATATPIVGDEVTDDDLDKLEDDDLDVVAPSDAIEEVTALPPVDTRSELFALLRIQSSKDKEPAAETPAANKNTRTSTKKQSTKKQSTKKTSAKKQSTKKQSTGKTVAGPAAAAPRDQPGLDAQRDAVIADAATQIETCLKRAMADEQNDLLASLRASKDKRTGALAAVVGDVDAHIGRYVIAISDVATVTYGAGAALVDAQAENGAMPAGAVEELLATDIISPIRDQLESLDAWPDDEGSADAKIDPLRAFYRGQKTMQVTAAASRLAHLLCVAGLHDACAQDR